MYWSGKPYYAFGVGAASYIQGRRFSRPRSMSHYKKWVAELVAGDSMPAGGTSIPASLCMEKELHTSG